MKKQQVILVCGAIVLLSVLYFFGRTLPINKPAIIAANKPPDSAFDINTLLDASKKQLSTEQQAYVGQLERSVVRGNVKDQQTTIYNQLAAFYKDTAHLLLPFAYYTGLAAKLENSEKSLTFAARFFLESVRSQENPSLKMWMANESKELFEKALVINPGNDSSKVGLGSCYLFGNISDNPMQGITMIRDVVARDPENMYAQYMLGMGALLSGQLDRAIERLSVVASKQPDNIEVQLILAETFERKGSKAEAAKWYEMVKSRVNNPEVVKEIDDRLRLLKK